MCYFMSVPETWHQARSVKHGKYTQVYFSDALLNPNTIPFLRQVIRRIVGLEVNPLPGGQVQPVQVCAVNVTCCPPKHVQEAIYNDHCLQEERYQAMVYLKLLLGKVCCSATAWDHYSVKLTKQ